MYPVFRAAAVEAVHQEHRAAAGEAEHQERRAAAGEAVYQERRAAAGGAMHPVPQEAAGMREHPLQAGRADAVRRRSAAERMCEGKEERKEPQRFSALFLSFVWLQAAVQGCGFSMEEEGKRVCRRCLSAWSLWTVPMQFCLMRHQVQ